MSGKLTATQELRKKNKLLPGEREKVFAEHSPVLRPKEEEDTDSEDDLYDESGDDSDEEGWSDNYEDSEEEEEEEEEEMEEKEPTPRANKEKSKKISRSTKAESSSKIVDTSSEDAYKESSLFQELEAFKNRTPSKSKVETPSPLNDSKGNTDTDSSSHAEKEKPVETEELESGNNQSDVKVEEPEDDNNEKEDKQEIIKEEIDDNIEKKTEIEEEKEVEEIEKKVEKEEEESAEDREVMQDLELLLQAEILLKAAENINVDYTPSEINSATEKNNDEENKPRVDDKEDEGEGNKDIQINVTEDVLVIDIPKPEDIEWQAADSPGRRTRAECRASDIDGVLLRPKTHKKTRSVDQKDLSSSKKKRKSLIYKLKIPRNSLDVPAAPLKIDEEVPLDSPHRAPISNHRHLESEMAIDGAPVTPGADYFYSPADLDLLKEMEEREAMKAAFNQRSKSDKTNEKSKKKLRVATEILKNLNKNEDKDTPFDMAEYNAQMLAVQKQKEIFRSENLLSESTDLPQDIRLRNMTINEIVSTERDFKVDLETIMEVFHDPLLSRNILDAQQLSSIFSNIGVICEICQTTIKQLEATIHHPDGPKISGCFDEIIKYHKMFSDYCNNHGNADSLVAGLLKKNSAFRQFIEEAQAQPRCVGMPFISYLIKPIQRICKYPLLLRELIKNEPDANEKVELRNVLENISQIVNSINETKRASENMSKIVSIQKKLISKNVDILQPGRSFVKEGLLQEHTKHGEFQVIYVCLFNDMIIRAEKKRKFGTMRRNEKMNVTDHALLYNIKVTTIPDSGEISHAFKVQFSKTVYTLCAASAKEKNEWLQAIKEQLMNLQNDLDVPVPPKPPPIINSPKPESPVTPPAEPSPSSSPSVGPKIKCYLNKGTPQQRIRKISLKDVQSVPDLMANIKKEFEWDSGKSILLSYEDEDKDIIEISGSTSIEDILEEAKCFLLTEQ